MHTNKPWLGTASWFTLRRHDDPPAPDPAPEPEPAPPDDPAPPDPEPVDDSPPDTGGEKDWKAEAEKWKALSRKHEKTAKDLAPAAKKLAEIEDAQKSEAEKLAAAKEAAEAKADAAIKRAIQAEIKALAASDFADPSDAEAAINPSEFVGDSGDIDVDAIKSKLAELLETKPHWRKVTEPTKPTAPKPDPGQGPRGSPAKADYRTAPREEFEAKLAEFGVRPRR